MKSVRPRRLPRLKTLALACATLLLTAALAHAQTDAGRIAGVVRDPAGAVVAGAAVVLKNERTGEERTATTNAEGVYQIPALKASGYTVTVTAPNFAANTFTDIQINVGQEQKLDVALTAAGVTESVEVVAGATEAAIDTGSARMGATVNEREVVGLPLNGRQLSQLYLQAPGSVNSGSGTFGDIRFSGRAVQQNVVRYDGVEGSAIIDASPGNLNGEVASPFRLQSSLENVQEFRVDSNNYPAEYGTGTGGQISVVTKSGGNQFHGSAFEYLRNSALDASNFFDNIVGQKSPLKLNQFGGSLGGPLVKDKLFFFGSYEGYRLRAGINSIEAVPGEASRVCAVVTCVASQLPYLAAFRSPDAAVISRGTGTNIFDVAQLQANSVVNEDAFSARGDYKLNASNSAYFRFFRDEGDNTQPEGVTGRRVVVSAVPQNAVAALQTVFSPRLLNEFKVGFNEAKTRINGQAPTVNGLDLSAVTINVSGNTANFNLPGQGTSAGTATPGGLVRANSATNGRGQPYTPYSLSFIDNLNYTRGSHNFRAGGEVRAIRLYTDRLGGTTYTYASLQNFLAGTLQSVQFTGDLSGTSPFTGVSGVREAEQEYYIAYAQDQWQVRPGLTLNYGLRYEYYTPLSERSDAQVLFDITTGRLRDPSQAPYKTSKTNFAPRVAVTWSPNSGGTGFFAGGKSVLRAGFGIFYGPGQTEDQIQPIESDRIQATITGSTLVNGTQLFAFPTNPALFADFFNSNPNNRSYQPRAYSGDYTVPERVYQYSVSYQQELPGRLVATVGYVGSQGRNLFLRSVANQILRGQAVLPSTATVLPAGAGVVNLTNAAGQVTTVRTVREFSIVNGTTVLNPYAEVDYKTSGGSDSYTALQAQLSRRFGTGLTMNAQYAFGKSFGTTAGSNEARTAANNARTIEEWDYDRGYNNFDVRHTFNLSAVYELPVGRGQRLDWGGVGNAVFGNWEIGTIFNARTGLPIEVGITRPDVAVQCVNSAGCNVNTSATATTTVPNGFTAQLPTVSSTQPLPAGFVAVVNVPGGGASRNVRRPNLIPGVSPYLNNDRSLLNPAAFAIPAAGAFGDLPRNALRGPGFWQADLIFNKRIPLGERVKLEFRTEVFNVFNHSNFAPPSSTLNVGLPTLTFNTTANAFVLGSGLQPGQAYTQTAAGSTFGLLRQTVERTVGLGTNRQIQFALRLNF
ncbi:MAG TPA: carboxypeptidase regulatory-like domain-containing protein [Pyrinomonadaceae bacterium]|nr:carboxypeptidase regulatory-like domain-containing protein [Pyrinomonadaceae bacterium]